MDIHTIKVEDFHSHNKGIEMFYIRADGNSQIGMGHIMRCLSIAEVMEEVTGQKPVFITADDECSALITDRGFERRVLHTDYRDMLSEIVLLKDMFDTKQDSLLVDSYQVSNAYFTELRTFVWVACLEDMGIPYAVDVLINYNLYALKCKENYQNTNIKDIDKKIVQDEKIFPDKVLLGIEYMPLRKAFREKSCYKVKDKITDVIVTTGGSDPYFAAGAITDAGIQDPFLSQQGIKWHIVSGPMNQFSTVLKEHYKGYKNVVIHENVQDMKEVFLKGDVVISAAGSTIYEVSSLGVPLIVFYFAKNQQQGAEEIASVTEIVNVGCYTQGDTKVVKKILKVLTQCVQSKLYRERLYEQEKQLIDKNGAMRLVQQLVSWRLEANT